MREVILKLPQRRGEYEDALSGLLDGSFDPEDLNEHERRAVQELRDALRAAA